MESAGLGGLSGTAHLTVFNPNSVSLPLKSAELHLGIGGVEAVSARVDLAMTLPAKASVPAQARLTLDALSAAQVIARYAAGERRYHLRGVLTFQTNIGDLSVQIQHQGQLGELVGSNAAAVQSIQPTVDRSPR